MKKLLLLLIIITTSTISAQDFDFTGKVKNAVNRSPLLSCYVTNLRTNVHVTTNAEGEFSIKAQEKDSIRLEFNGLVPKTIPVVNSKKTLIVFLNKPEELLEKSNMALSMNNYWLGGKIGYNIASDPDDNNFVGAANINVNVIKCKDSLTRWGVVGNLGNYKFTKEDQDNVEKLAQSMTGILVGLGYTHDIADWSSTDKISVWRRFITTSAKFTKHNNIGVNKESINFVQSVTTFGLEWERRGFPKDGALTVTATVSAMFFDKNQYKMIFGQNRDLLVPFDITAILPINQNIGFFVNSTIAVEQKPIWAFGVVLK